MEDIASTKGGSGIKRKRPGRDKESRIKDLSDTESSEDSDSSVDKEKASPVKSSKGQAANSDIKAKESKSSEATSKLIGKESSSMHSLSDKHKKQKLNKDGRPSDSSESNSWSSASSSQTREAKRESLKKEKELRNSIINRMLDTMKDSLASIKLSFERQKYEISAKIDETLKKHSPDFKSTVETSLGPKSRDDLNKIESQGEVHNRKDKCGTSNYDVENDIKSKKIINDSIPEMEDIASTKGGSGIKRKRPGRDKESRIKDLSDTESSEENGKWSPQKKIIKEGQRDQSQMESTKMHIVPDKFNEKQDKSIDKKGKQPQSHGNISEASSSSSEHGKRSPQKKIIKEGQKDQSQIESTKMHIVPDKFNEKQDKSNDKKGKQPQSHGNLSEASSSSSESIAADSHTQEQSPKENNSKADKPKDLLIEGEFKKFGVNVPQAETNLDIKNDSPSEKEIKREKSASRSSSRHGICKHVKTQRCSQEIIILIYIANSLT